MNEERTRHRTPSLRLYRLLAGKTQREVGEEAGVSDGFVSGLETGRLDARPSTVEALALAVYAEISDLLKESPAGPPEEELAGSGTPAARRPDPIPEVGERVVLIATGRGGEVEDSARCHFTGQTYLRIVADDFPYPLVQSSLAVRKETL